VTPGTHKASLTGIGDYSGTVVAKVTVSVTALSTDDVTGIESSYNYTGFPITITPSILIGKSELVAGTDYLVTYTDAAGGAIIVYGNNFPDALAGAALCGSKSSALLLVDDNEGSKA
jgi:hypothetical protein